MLELGTELVEDLLCSTLAVSCSPNKLHIFSTSMLPVKTKIESRDEIVAPTQNTLPTVEATVSDNVNYDDEDEDEDEDDDVTTDGAGSFAHDPAKLGIENISETYKIRGIPHYWKQGHLESIHFLEK